MCVSRVCRGVCTVRSWRVDRESTSPECRTQRVAGWGDGQTVLHLGAATEDHSGRAHALLRARVGREASAMIAEVDEALCRALARVLPKGTVVRLDPPKPTWQTEKPSQAIDLFLFNLASDERRLMSGYDEVRDPDGRVLSRRDPAKRYFLSYLVTARAPKIAEEHELLDTALRALTDNESLPTSCLPDALLETGMPVLV